MMIIRRRMRGSGFIALAVLLVGDLATAATTIESIGAESCGGRVGVFDVEFLAPDAATLEASAKAVLKGGSPSPDQNAISLSIDGKPCTDARCVFQARKGQTYKFAAATKLRAFEDLCIVVARP